MFVTTIQNMEIKKKRSGEKALYERDEKRTKICWNHNYNNDGSNTCYWTGMEYGATSKRVASYWIKFQSRQRKSCQHSVSFPEGTQVLWTPLCPYGECFKYYKKCFIHLQSIGRMLLARKKFLKR